MPHPLSKIVQIHMTHPVQEYKCSNLNKVFNKFSFVILQKRTCCGKHGTLEIRTYSIEPIIMQRHLVINWNVSTVIKFQYAHFFFVCWKNLLLSKVWVDYVFFCSTASCSLSLNKPNFELFYCLVFLGMQLIC